MAAGFLQQTASYLWNRYGTDLQHFCLVFPNKRAPLFFSRYLSQCTDTPIWAPAYSSTESLVTDITGWHITDRLHALVTLYHTFKDIAHYRKEFSEFWQMGELILNDFDEIDRQMAPAAALFRNVADLNALKQDFSFLTPNQEEAIREFWKNFGENEGKDLKQHFTGIWPLLAPLYEAFHERLAEECTGYEGMVQRRAAEMLSGNPSLQLKHKCFVFIGFHALTACEKRIFSALKESGRALFFWDYDTYFTSDEGIGKVHEAGRFLKDYIRQFPAPDDWTFDCQCLCSPKDWKVVNVPSETGQARMAGTLLEELAGTPGLDWSRTAVVLPDEHMLMPMLSCIPPAIGKINITMGCAFSMTPAAGLYDRLFQLQHSARENDGGILFYHLSVKALLLHPYIQLFAPELFSLVLKKITEQNLITLTSGTILELMTEAAEECEEAPLVPVDALASLAGKLFTPHRDAQYPSYLKDVTVTIAAMMRQCDLGNDDARFLYPVTCLYTAVTTLQRLADVLTGDVAVPWDDFAKLFRQYGRNLRIPFSGEPLEGLQIMGMLETRTLDFDNVIVLSMNEGIMPPATNIVSLIPYSFRKPFGLPGQEHRESLHAYSFYRLMQRAQFIRCIWFTGDAQHVEQSRFLTQLLFEPAFNIRTEQVSFNVQAQKTYTISEPRTGETSAMLARYIENGTNKSALSPSAINTYLECRLKFWFKVIKRLKEPDEVAEEIDARIFGNIFHKTMETLYKRERGHDADNIPFETKYGHLSSETLRQTEEDVSHIRKVLNRTIQEEFFKNAVNPPEDGRTLIISEVLFKYIKKLLHVEQQDWGGFTPVLLEGRVVMPVAVGPDKSTAIRVGGCIDRMDWQENALRILDYKTGSTDRKMASVESLFDRGAKHNKAVTQLMIYSYIVSSLLPWSRYTVIPGIINLRELFGSGCDYHLLQGAGTRKYEPIIDFGTLKEEFGQHLQTLLEEIFCSDQPFDQTEDLRTCEYCPYKSICRR